MKVVTDQKVVTNKRKREVITDDKGIVLTFTNSDSKFNEIEQTRKENNSREQR